jgi:hypothetical protein
VKGGVPIMKRGADPVMIRVMAGPAMGVVIQAIPHPGAEALRLPPGAAGHPEILRAAVIRVLLPEGVPVRAPGSGVTPAGSSPAGPEDPGMAADHAAAGVPTGNSLTIPSETTNK